MHATTLGLSSLCTKCSIAMVPLLKQSANQVSALTTLFLTCLSAHPWCNCAPGAMLCCTPGANPNQGMAQLLRVAPRPDGMFLEGTGPVGAPPLLSVLA